MSRPANLKTKIFLDGGDPEETKQTIGLLGFLDGQTTNPTLISKNPQVAKRLESGEKFPKGEIFDFYKKVVKEISALIPQGSVSVEVYADKNTSEENMFTQGREMFSWIPNAHIKYPTTTEGLKAAQKSINEGLRVNMTLCFTQDQAAAVYAATLQPRAKLRGSGQAKIDSAGSLNGFKNVFVSPFIGRLDDRGENGMDLIKNILKMYGSGDGHVAVLTASVRNLDHLLYALALGSDIVTAPFKILKEWAGSGIEIPDESFIYVTKDLKPMPYKDLNLERDWKEFDIHHQLTEAGIERFSSDWNRLIK